MKRSGQREQVEGTARSLTTFQELDADSCMKLPALFHPCLDPLTKALESNFDLFGMGRRGIAPLTYFVELTAPGTPLALGRPLEFRFSIRLCRANRPSPRPGEAPEQRLVLDQHVAVQGYRRSGGARDLGFDDGTGPAVPAGGFRLIQVFTRPMAPPGKRQVSEVPPEFQGLREHILAEPLPAPAVLWEAPEGVAEIAVTPEEGELRVFGRGNTDINHHVTVTEYLRALENHLALQLHRARLPVQGHRLERIRCTFRKPSFSGDTYRVQGKVYHGERQTRLLGGVYRCGAEGRPERIPSVTACLEGVFEGEAVTA